MCRSGAEADDKVARIHADGHARRNESTDEKRINDLQMYGIGVAKNRRLYIS